MSPEEKRRREEALAGFEPQSGDEDAELRAVAIPKLNRGRTVVRLPSFEKVRNDLIQVEGYDMILAPNTLVYANPINDITKKVTERMNEQAD